MDKKESIFMNKGDGENSFAKNSAYTQTVVFKTKPLLESALQSLFTKDFFTCKLLNVADLGCSSNPSAYALMSTVIENVRLKCRELNCQVPEIQFYLNDLVGNDFNTLFNGLSTFDQKGVSCFVMAAPGSFHGRLFPRNTMDLIHSSYSVHWLSQAPSLTSKEGLPLNKGKMYISKTSPPAVSKAYLAQFQEDFILFLKSRSQEVVSNGVMVLTLHGRQSPDPSSKQSCYLWDLLADATAHMISLGLVEESKLDSFNVPYYIPSQEELQNLVDGEGSFATEHMDTFTLLIGDKNIWPIWELTAKNIRSFTEPMMSNHFGEAIMDKLYNRLTHLLVEDLAKESPFTISIIVVLRKK
ncbi:Methyltransf_7 domain-containing protein [Cephalotus follicularis]|uniref:Methyltransf_7 domain-containing protein n=1 Tax=Cephalotus follicularis TaxID=3775 RepID=A0A1Q3AM05_CEPFO|nr:Methyltransf_7 domain-containing protein [Cephalotus follicularis]